MTVDGPIIDWHSATPMPNYARRTKDPDWERKQQQREYRVAARREKRLRKADEKKQRKLNATVLRRMTRNPAKYTKNVDRNRIRACEAERRRIRELGMQQVRELAAMHDTTGEMFNIGPVVVTDDGKVRSADGAKRWQTKQIKKKIANGEIVEVPKKQPESAPVHDIDQERSPPRRTEKKIKEPPKQNGLLQLPKPHIPDGIGIPQGEEDWVALWDITDAEIQKRLARAKKKAAAQRKALRSAQQSGKLERRAARDEKRKVYKELKETWKAIKGRAFNFQ